jgi:hypothetical protein
MDRSREFEIIVNRARRGGYLKAHYPAEGLAVLELGKVDPKPVAETLAPEPAPAAISRPVSGNAQP